MIFRRPASWKNSNPVIAGAAKVGESIVVQSNGIVSGATFDSRYWVRSPSTESPSYTPITRSTTYTPAEADEDQYIRLRETWSGGVTIYSNWIGPIAEADAGPSAYDPVIAGTPTEGFTLTATPGYGGEGATLTGASWVYGAVSGTPDGTISGETNPTIVLPSSVNTKHVAYVEDWTTGDRTSNWIGPVAAATSFTPTAITPGATSFGSWAETSPSNVGGSPTDAYDQKAVAAWATVTNQPMLDGDEIYVGVIADHWNGIDRVEFACDGGSWLSVSTTTTNPNHHGKAVTAYWCKIRAADLADGRHEIRAVAYPATAGVPRCLQGDVNTSENAATNTYRLEVFVNKNGTAYPYSGPAEVWCDSTNGNDANDGTEGNPVQTLYQATYRLANSVGGSREVGGKTIHLAAGDYNLGSYTFSKLNVSDASWLILKPAAGVAKSEVRIVSHDGSGMKRTFIKFEGLTIRPNMKYAIAQSGGANGAGFFWCDKCDIESPNDAEAVYDPDNGATEPTAAWQSGYVGGFFTECQATDILSTFYSGMMAVGCDINGCADDAYRNLATVIECTARNIHSHGTAAHPDIWQRWKSGATIENVVVSGLEALTNIEAQGLFFHGFTALFKDCSFRNVRIDNGSLNGTTVLVNLHAHRPMQHVLIRDSWITGGMWRTGQDPENNNNHNIFSATWMLLDQVYKVDGSSSVADFCVAIPDASEWDGATLPFESELGVTYND
jgi:hypothetical protein